MRSALNAPEDDADAGRDLEVLACLDDEDRDTARRRRDPLIGLDQGVGCVVDFDAEEAETGAGRCSDRR